MSGLIKKYQHQLLVIGLVVEGIVLLISYYQSTGSWLLLFRIAARLSGRVSFMYFTLFAIYSTLNPSIEKASEQLRVKFTLSKNLAILHVIHWFLLGTAILSNHFPIEGLRLLPGILAYAMIVAMPFILKGNLFARISLKVAESVYIYYVWLLFFLTYLARLSGNSPTATGSFISYLTMMGFAVGLLLWRIGYLTFLKRKKAFFV